MPSPLAPCPGCQRHVRVGDASCPFCARDLGDLAAPDGAMPTQRLSRAALFAFATGVASLGCTPSTTPTPPPAQPSVQPDYNPPPVPPPPPPAVAGDVPLAVAAYGAPMPIPPPPPPRPQHGLNPDLGGAAARYGTPPAPDAM